MVVAWLCSVNTRRFVLQSRDGDIEAFLTEVKARMDRCVPCMQLVVLYCIFLHCMHGPTCCKTPKLMAGHIALLPGALLLLFVVQRS